MLSTVFVQHNGTTTGTGGPEAIASDEFDGQYYQPRACKVLERRGCAHASFEVWMCLEIGTDSFLFAKDLREHNVTTTGTVGTEAIVSN